MMFLNKPVALVAAVLVVLAASETTLAALPPGSYNKLRNEAPEKLVVEVEKTAAVVNGKMIEYTVEAKVLAAEASATGLKPGAKIVIKYQTPATPIPGPMPQGPLAKGAILPAYLEQAAKAKDYGLAAHGMSFTLTSD